jgi:hypothetical protein
MSTTEERVSQAVREIFEFGAAQPSQFSLTDIRQHRSRRWAHSAVVVAVAAAIVVVFFVPLPNVSLFNHLFSSGSSKTSPTASQAFPPPRTVAAFEAEARTASRSSYVATYQTRYVDGSIMETTVARRGVQSMWLVKPLGTNGLQQAFIQVGRHTVSCQATNEGPWSCQSPSEITGSPSWALTFLQTLPIPSTLPQPHETLRLAQQRLDGRKVTCLFQAWTDTGWPAGSETSQWCINSSGIFTYVDNVTGAAGPKHIISTLVSWSRSVPEALFNEPTSTAVAPGRPWAQTALLTEAGTAAPVQLPGTPYAYVVASSSVTGSSSPGRLVRIDLAAGRVTEGPALASGSFLLAIGGQIAVLSPARYSVRKGPSGPETLRLVQGSSMTLGRGVVVAAPSLGYQTTLVNPGLANHGLWYQVGSGNEIALVDTLTGTVLRSMGFPSTVMSVASSPDGRLVYATFDGTDPRTKPPAGAIVIDELDASSLKVLARQYLDGAVMAFATAVPGGVWVANSGGMQWSEFLYLSPKLSQVVRKPLFPFPSGTIPTLDGVVTQGDSAQVFGRSVFLVGSAGASCDNPSTGLFIAGASFPELSGGGFESWDLFAAWHGLLYGVRFAASLLSFEILRIQPPTTCRA